jgi:hypothetical protein
MDESLHDAFLTSFNIGDRVLYRRNAWRTRKETRAQVEFLNYGGDRTYQFTLMLVERVQVSLAAETRKNKNFGLGMLFIYELTRAKSGNLQLNFLFDSGGEIEVEFGKLEFKKKQLGRHNKN